MAGHSKWANIKHRKSAADARRSKLFSKLAKYIMVAARNGGPNPAENLRLRYAVDRAKAESMPKDSIERAIKKGAGELEGDDLAELTYEGIGPGGISLIVEVLTDNRNRTGGEVRNLLEKRGGSLGKANSVAWKFDRRGIIALSKEDVQEEEVFEAAIEAGAENIEEEDEAFVVQTTVEALEDVREALQALVEKNRRVGEEKKWGETEDERPIFVRNELVYLPQNPIPISDAAKARQVLDIVGELEDHDDVQAVFSDFDVPEKLMEEILAE